MISKIMIILSLILASSYASAEELEVKLESLTNIKGNGAMEACGLVENNGKTSSVTITHSESSYTTLTDTNGKWCQVIRRWTFNGEVELSARAL